MSSKTFGLTRNGIKEECKWDVATEKSQCPRHYIHINSAKARVSDHLVWEDTNFEDDSAAIKEYLTPKEYKESLEYIDWNQMSRIPHADELYYSGRNSGTIHVRQSGKVYQIHTVRTVDIDSTAANEALVKLAAVSSDMDDAVISNENEAIGGGHGNYDYATVTRVEGWVTMSPEQVEAWKTIQHNSKEIRKAEREIKRLEKMSQSIKKRMGNI